MGKPGAAASACLQLHWDMGDVSRRCCISIVSTWDLAPNQQPLIPLESIYVSVCVQSCLTLCDLTDYSLPVFSIHGILQESILEWIAMPSSKGPSPPKDGTVSPALQADSLPLNHQGSLRASSQFVNFPYPAPPTGLDGGMLKWIWNPPFSISSPAFLLSVRGPSLPLNSTWWCLEGLPPPCPRTHFSISAFPPLLALFLWNDVVAPWSPCRVHVTIRAALMEHLVRKKQDSLGVQLPDAGSLAGFLHPSNTLCPELWGREEQRP